MRASSYPIAYPTTECMVECGGGSTLQVDSCDRRQRADHAWGVGIGTLTQQKEAEGVECGHEVVLDGDHAVCTTAEIVT